MSAPRLTILFSGGADSLLLWWLALAAGRRASLLYCRIGATYEAAELEACAELQRLAAPLGLELEVETLQLPGLGAREDLATGYIPLRNDLLVRMAALDADEVWLGAVRGESSRDKSARFLHDTSAQLSYLLGRRVAVRAPLRHLTKTAAVRDALLTFPGTIQLLQATRSCYRLHLLPLHVQGCGACAACFRRWVAWTLNGLPLRTLVDPPTWAEQSVRARGGLWPVVRRALREVPMREWWHVLVNNYEAGRAMAQVHAERKG